MLKPRIMIVGEFMWPWYQEACAAALEKIECDIIRFGWFDEIWCWRPGWSEPVYRSFWRRVQYRLQFGPSVWRIFYRLINQAIIDKPDVIWFYNVQLITPSVVKALKKRLPTTIFVQYSNDNPFSPAARPALWKNYVRSIPLFDLHFTYRESNILDYKRAGAHSIHFLRSYFIPHEDFPTVQGEIPERFKCDVVFAGHYEDDGRLEILEAICQAGFRLNLFGGGWNAALPKLKADSPLRSKYPIRPVTNADYRYAICGAKVALCFLSTLNRDTYTRRNFQIPAMQVAMLSQYTDDLASLYREDTEAVFFRDQDELLLKLAKLLSDDVWRISVAKAGYAKVYAAGHDVNSRMASWLDNLRRVRSLSRISR